MAVNSRVFISYSWVDKPLARRLARRLRHGGVDVFLDETHLGPGMRLPDMLKQEIRGSSHVLVVWTAAAAASHWVAQEVEYASTTDTRPVLVPLLFAPPGTNSIIAHTIGIDFSQAHRFERAFGQVCTVAGLHRGPPPSREALTADLAATLRETPSIAGLFGSPIDRVVTDKELRDVRLGEALTPDDASTQAARAKTLSKAREAFESWKPERVSVAGLPTVSDPDFHALDFAMWCAAGITLLKTDELKPLAAPEVKTYPGIFAKAFGATGAGFEAILLILARFPGFANDPMRELVKADQVREATIAPVVELYETVFHLVAEDEGRDQFMPYSCAERFVLHNRARLSDAQKQTFLRLVDVNGNGPYPGGPLDMLGTLYRDAGLSEEVLGRILFWVENGFFDRADPATRSEMPRLFYGFTAGLIKDGAADPHVQRLLDAAAQRIRKHFRAAKTETVPLALQWIADADRLPMKRRGCVERGFQEGAYSSEFEGWEHARLVEPLARALVGATVRQGDDASRVKATIRQALRDAGLPDRLL
jgi:hypothetical protein